MFSCTPFPMKSVLKVFILTSMLMGCTYEVALEESDIINSDFVYEEIHFKSDSNFDDWDHHFGYATVTIQNLSGIEISYANFELSMFDAQGHLLEVDEFFITNFQSGTIRHFKQFICCNADVRKIADYKIQYIGYSSFYGSAP